MKATTILNFFLLLSLPSFTLAQTAIKAEKVYTVTAGAIQNGVILVKDGKIEKIGKEGDIKIPSNYTVVEAKVVTPGLIDARSVVGLSGPLNIPSDQDQLEKSSPIQPDLRAIDAYNTEDKLVKYVRDNGVTTLHTGHGIGALVSGQTMVVKTKPGTVDHVTIIPAAMLAMTIGPAVQGNFPSPGTKAKQIAMLRTELIKAQDYLKKMNAKDSTKRPAEDLKLEMLGKLLTHDMKALITVNTTNDIMNAIRLAKEFNFQLVIDGAAEAYRLTDEIKAAHAEVILHATMARNGGDMINMTRESAAILTKAGIPISIESGYEAYVPKTRVILWEAAIAVANGLPFEDGLKAITINPAKLLGIDNHVGSIEKGKDADLVLYNGDPFEYLTKVCKVMIDGNWVSNNCE
ncbi:MAG: amidohydrolase family protein [Bacteroidota bacterium]|nr:amidohydrolase family protein [Bacteroidota bacterium]